MDLKVLLDLSVNLIAGLIGFWIGWVWQRFKRLSRSRRAKRFWKPFVEGELQIVLGRFLEFKSFEESGFLGVGDAVGLSELGAHFEAIGLGGFTVSYADRLDGDALKTNLILLGGPDANAISREIVQKVNSTLRFGNPANYEISIYDSKNQKIYVPTRQPDLNEINIDYGVILKTNNPFAPTKQVLLIAGSFGYGTWAGVRFALSKRFLDDAIVANGKPIECLIETDIVRGTPQDIRLIVLRPLEREAS